TIRPATLCRPRRSPASLQGGPAMHARLLTTLLFGLALFLGCSPALQVRMDFDHSATFAAYHSFQMGEGKVIEKGAPSENSIVKDRVNVGVRAGLVMR